MSMEVAVAEQDGAVWHEVNHEKQANEGIRKVTAELDDKNSESEAKTRFKRERITIPCCNLVTLPTSKHLFNLFLVQFTVRTINR